MQETIEKLINVISNLLEEHPDGLNEQALIKALRQHKLPYFGNGGSGDRLTLFRSHFLLMHALYRLRQLWHKNGVADLEISPLLIRKCPYQPVSMQPLATNDPLQRYYLDLEHLRSTSLEDLDQLITDFWRRCRNNSKRKEALAVLGLSDPIDLPTIKLRYRELAMQHHPDRGGDTASIQLLNQAMAILDK